MNPLAPAIYRVTSDKKIMLWPLTFAAPGRPFAEQPKITTKDDNVQVITQPAAVVAVARFSDASVESVVRTATRELQAACQRDGLVLQDDTNELQFCQYDAIYSMGQRRGEVWIPLKEGEHPWSK